MGQIRFYQNGIKWLKFLKTGTNSSLTDFNNNNWTGFENTSSYFRKPFCCISAYTIESSQVYLNAGTGREAVSVVVATNDAFDYSATRVSEVGTSSASFSKTSNGYSCVVEVTNSSGSAVEISRLAFCYALSMAGSYFRWSLSYCYEFDSPVTIAANDTAIFSLVFDLSS